MEINEKRSSGSSIGTRHSLAPAGGFMTMAQGGKFGAGFLSGGFGSAFGGKVGKWLKNARDFPKFIGTTIAGGISGGVGSRLAGGKFWDGFRNGAISAGLNHAAHEIQRGVKIIRSTREALKHYFNGNGESVNLHPDIKRALLKSNKFIRKAARIFSGKTSSLKGSFSIDLTKEFFHVGKTNVEYSINSFDASNIKIDFNLFVNDGFWDVDFIDENTYGRLGLESYKPDGLGPNLERFGGTPYRYISQTVSYIRTDPGYFNN